MNYSDLFIFSETSTSSQGKVRWHNSLILVNWYWRIIVMLWVKTWDVRVNSCIADLTLVNEPGNHATFHIHVSVYGLESHGQDEDSRFLSDNLWQYFNACTTAASKWSSAHTDMINYISISSSLYYRRSWIVIWLAGFVSGHEYMNGPIKNAFQE